MTAKLLYIDFCHVLTLLEGFNATLEISNGPKIRNYHPIHD